jgi:hypothetical protein
VRRRKVERAASARIESDDGDVPAVFVGNKFAAKIPMKLVHSIAAGIFALMGLLTLLKIETLFQ